jgi:hypothetical protein
LFVAVAVADFEVEDFEVEDFEVEDFVDVVMDCVGLLVAGVVSCTDEVDCEVVETTKVELDEACEIAEVVDPTTSDDIEEVDFEVVDWTTADELCDVRAVWVVGNVTEGCTNVAVVETDTPGLVVGIVTLATLATLPTLRDILVVDVLVGVVVVLIAVTVVVVNDGHKAPIIPPFSIIPSREFALTLAPEQASDTHAALEVKAA